MLASSLVFISSGCCKINSWFELRKEIGSVQIPKGTIVALGKCLDQMVSSHNMPTKYVDNTQYLIL